MFTKQVEEKCVKKCREVFGDNLDAIYYYGAKDFNDDINNGILSFFIVYHNSFNMAHYQAIRDYLTDAGIENNFVALIVVCDKNDPSSDLPFFERNGYIAWKRS